MDRRAQNRERDRKGQRSGRAILVRLYWMFLGYIPIVAFSSAIIESKAARSWADIAFWASVISILIARLYDITRLGGTTAEGDPATLGHWMRHVGWLIVAAMVVWGAMRLT